MLTASRVFEQRDADAFAAVSGDWNPAHVDPLAARRRIAGGPIAHGIHVLLWALDVAAAAGMAVPGFRRLTALFRQPVHLGVRTTVAIRPNGNALLVAVESDGRPAIEAEVLLDAGRGSSAGAPSVVTSGAQRGHPRQLDASQIAAAAGSVPLVLDGAAAEVLFPTLVSQLNEPQMAMLLAISRMAGMECPGDRSVLHRCDLALDDVVEPASVPGSLRFRVERFDPRFSSARIRVDGAGCSGTVDAFLAPLPVVQPSSAEVLSHVTRGEFSGVRALVVGGSRGLGEATAKLLAAGGADVVITYNVGRLDAASVCQDISAAGGRAQAVTFDVLDDRNDAAPVLPASWAPSHLFYFATPRIVLAEGAGFSAARFRRYTAFYVEGFVRLIEGCVANSGDELTAFYPSTTALDVILPKAIEYASAKAAGEAACRHLSARYPRLRVQISRLPRTRTDATATVVPVEDQEATAVMRDELRRLMTMSAPRAEGMASPR